MKHPNFKPHQLAIFSIAGSALLACGTGLFSSNLQAQPQVASPAAEGRRGEAITLNFVNANIDAVARTMATLTGRNVVVDPRVKGTITLTTERPVSPAVAYSQFLAILRLQGFTVVNAAGLDKIVPEADAKLQGGAVSTNVPVVTGDCTRRCRTRRCCANRRCGRCAPTCMVAGRVVGMPASAATTRSSRGRWPESWRRCSRSTRPGAATGC